VLLENTYSSNVILPFVGPLILKFTIPQFAKAFLPIVVLSSPLKDIGKDCSVLPVVLILVHPLKA
jgi:hypothetical protein